MTSRLRSWLLGIFPSLGWLWGCSLFESPGTEATTQQFSVTIETVKADQPVPLAKILRGKQLLGTTDATGKAQLKLAGSEGETQQLTVQCPEGLVSPDKPVSVALRAMAPGSPEPKFQVECVPLKYEVVVGVRANHGANLPVLYLDEVVGETNAEGVAHVKLKVSPKEQVTLKLDTSKQPNLRPQNPMLTFVAKDKDEMILLEQEFEVVRKKVIKPKPNIPQPL